MRTSSIHNSKEYKVKMLKAFIDPCECCKKDNVHCRKHMCLFKAQRNWKKYRKTQYKS